MKTQVKICGIATSDEARMALAAGADALGFNCVDPPSPRTIAETKVAEIVRELGAGPETFLLTNATTADVIASQLGRTGVTTIQILAPVGAEEVARLAALAPRVRRVQVVHVESRAALDMIPAYAPHVDAFLLDSGRPRQDRPEYGGTGRTHDWDVSAAFVEAAGLPVYLAGGLNAENVREAIRKVRPCGVDLSTGVRTDGRLDAQKVRDFILAVKGEDAAPRLG